jgi:hypothetical protein
MKRVWKFWRWVAGTILIFLSGGTAMAVAEVGPLGTTEPLRAVYGFSKKIDPFQGKTNQEIVEFLKTYNLNAIFGQHDDDEFVDTCHRNGIRVYAEAAIFVGEKYWKEHPESRPITASGEPLEKIEWYAGVCPNQPWLWQEKLEMIRTMVRETKLDGIWLDFIRYPCHWEVKSPRLDQTCFCPVCMKQFQKDTGITIPAELVNAKEKAQWVLKHHRNKFIEWKCERIALFVQKAREVIKAERPGVLVGLFGVPWMPTELDDAIHAIIGQDYRMLAPYVDVFSPMVYHRMCGRDTKWISDVTRYLVRITRKPVVPIIQACSLPDKLTDAEFKQAMEAALSVPSAGVIIFNLKYLIEEKKPDVLR